MSEINEIMLIAFLNRIKADDMTVEQVPIPYQQAIQQKLELEKIE